MFKASSSRLVRRIGVSPQRANAIVIPRHPSHPIRLPSRSLATLRVPKSNVTPTTPILEQKDPIELENVTTLPNGIRVASEALPGVFSGVGVYITAGSRFETPSLRGVSHIMDRLAFKSTTKRSAEQMLQQVETLGGNIQCASSRESILYQAATFNNTVPEVVELLADTIRNPKIDVEEVYAQLNLARYEITEIWKKAELILPEVLHMAAYRDNTIGNPLLCPLDRLDYINKRSLEQYRELFYRPERMVIAFAGVDHDTAVSLTEKYFGDMPASASTSDTLPTYTPTPTVETPESPGASTTPDTTPDTTSIASSTPPSSSSSSDYGSPPSSPITRSFNFLSTMMSKSISTSAPTLATVLPGFSPSTSSGPAHYTGGFLSLPPQEHSTIPNQPNFSHIQIAFEGIPIGHDDVYAFAALQILLGGGGSFSAGGPGKGMYSRLYTGVLNCHGWVESCVAVNHLFSDTGLFGISASCMPGRLGAMIDVICGAFRSLTLESGFSAVTEAEVERAKKQLRSALLMNLESRMVLLEDIGRQVQIHGRILPVKDTCRKIESLTIKDLRRVAGDIVKGRIRNAGQGTGLPTVVLQEAKGVDGSVEGLDWEHIRKRIERWELGRR